MEMCTSEEELVVKMRKPYTITKQRERWTDEEHKRFLEALKTYGRAWQRIEEHIGTKTAVQIRSHAQKFFSKLEKEAQAKGVALRHAYDIDIPPPRPKRKPNNPYPRKTFNGAICSSGESTSSSPNKDGLCLNKDAAAPEKLDGTETMGRMKVASQNGNLEMINVFQEDTHLTVKACGDPSYSRDPIAINTYPTVEEDNKKKQSAPNFDELGKCSLEGLCLQSDKWPPADGSLDKSMTVDKSALVSDNLHRVQGHQKLETVHLQDGNIESTHCNSNTGRPLCHQPVVHALPNLFKHSAVSGISEQHTKSTISFPHQLPCFPPFALLQNSQVSFGSNISSTFTNLIVSALLQNPAAHAAASLMASYWPSLDTDISLNSTAESFKDGTFPRPMNPAPSVAAIAAATVAAATAWWATHGLFPICHTPCPTGMTFPYTAVTTNLVRETNTAGGINKEQTKDTTTVRSSEDLQGPATEPKRFSAFSSLKSEDSIRGGMTCAAELKNCNRSPKADDLLCATDTGILDYNYKERNKKKQDRCSCGSNTASSSEETEEKVVLAEDLKKAQTAHSPIGETNNRRTRSSSGVTESWKEVSQEGRQAFQALFSRDVLPQSFSPPQAGESVTENDEEKSSNTLLVDLNKKAWTDSGKDHVLIETPMRDAFYFNKSSLANRRAGFKPYKRCSEEAKESRAADSDDKINSKRLRLEGESSVYFIQEHQ